LDELLRFPNGKHDDQVDSISQFLKLVDKLPPCGRRNRLLTVTPGRKFTLRDAHMINPHAAKNKAWRVKLK